MAYDILVELDETLAAGEAEALDLDALRTSAHAVLAGAAVEDEAAVTVLLGGPALLQELNREHRGIDEPTDVLSFPADEGEPFPGAPDEPRYLGDIAVSVATVGENARAASIDASLELRHVVVHGLLHLLGYDHETPEEEAEMRAREEAVLGPEVHAGREGESHSD